MQESRTQAKMQYNGQNHDAGQELNLLCHHVAVSHILSPLPPPYLCVLSNPEPYSFIVPLCFVPQVRKLNLGQKKAHLIEIQVNGGASASDKVDFAVKLFEKAVTVDSVFSSNEMIDTIAITKVRD